MEKTTLGVDVKTARRFRLFCSKKGIIQESLLSKIVEAWLDKNDKGVKK